MRDLRVAARAAARLQAQAVPVSVTRRIRVRPDALLLSFTGTAGEHDGTVHAFTAGPAGGDDVSYGVPDPRDRDSQHDLFRALAHALDPVWERARESGQHPQVVVSGNDAATRLGHIAQRLCLSRGVAPAVRRLGERLAFFADRTGHAGQQSLVVATDAVVAHVTTGQAPPDDAHLGAVLEWIRPGSGGGGNGPLMDRIERAERLPAGPAPSPVDDRVRLVPALDSWARARLADDPAAKEMAARQIALAIGPGLQHQHALLRAAVEFLTCLPVPDLPDLARPHDPRTVLDRLDGIDDDAFAGWCRHLDLPDHRISFVDTDRAAAFRLAATEPARENLDAAVLLGDRLAREASVADGTAVRITVYAVAEHTAPAGPARARQRVVVAGACPGPLVPAAGQTWRQAAPGAPAWRVEATAPGADGNHFVTLSRPAPADAVPGAELDLVAAVPDWTAAAFRRKRLADRARKNRPAS